MGEPLELDENSIREAFKIFDSTISELEKDRDMFQDFVDEASEVSVSSVNSNGLNGNGFDSGGSKEVIDMYEEMFYSRQTSKDRVKTFAEKLGLSLPAADLFDELSNVPDISDDHAYGIVNQLDSGNVNEIVMGSFRNVAEYPAVLRERIIEDAEIEKESLWKYFKDTKQLYEQIDDLNREKTLPMSIDDAVEVVEALEQIEERAEQLKARRVHEIDRRDEYMNGLLETQEEAFYEESDMARPVLEELSRIEVYVDEMYDAITVK